MKPIKVNEGQNPSSVTPERPLTALAWRPIDTAPRDGTLILGFGESNLIFVMRCFDAPLGSGRWLERYSGDEIYPECWMPLPDPPRA